MKTKTYNLPTVLLVILLSMILGAALRGADLPADAQAVAAKADKAIAAIRADADAKADKVQQAEIVALKRYQDAAMAKKDLDGATLVKARIDDLQKQVDDYHEVFAPKAPPVNLVGAWRIDGVGDFNIVSEEKATAPGITGIISIKNNTLEVLWSNGYTDSYTYPPATPTTLDGQNQLGKKLHATKQ